MTLQNQIDAIGLFHISQPEAEFYRMKMLLIKSLVWLHPLIAHSVLQTSSYSLPFLWNFLYCWVRVFF